MQQRRQSAPTMYRLGERHSIPSASTVGGETTKVMNSDDVPQRVRTSFSSLYPWSMRAVA